MVDSGLTGDGEWRLVVVVVVGAEQLGVGDVPDLPAAVQQAQATAVPSHVLRRLPPLPRPSQRHRDARRPRRLPLLSTVSTGPDHPRTPHG